MIWIRTFLKTNLKHYVFFHKLTQFKIILKKWWPWVSALYASLLLLWGLTLVSSLKIKNWLIVSINQINEKKSSFVYLRLKDSLIFFRFLYLCNDIKFKSSAWLWIPTELTKYYSLRKFNKFRWRILRLEFQGNLNKKLSINYLWNNKISQIFQF